MRTFKTRLLSLALALVMVISMLPAALATDAVPMTRDENESGVVMYTKTATLSGGEVSAAMTSVLGYLGNNTTLTEAPAEAVVAITGATTADGEPVTYYYSTTYVAGASASDCATAARDNLYNATVLFLKDQTLDLATSCTWLYMGSAPKGQLTVDLGGNVITYTGGYFFNAQGTSDLLVKNGTLIRTDAAKLGFIVGNNAGDKVTKRSKITLKGLNLYSMENQPLVLRSQCDVVIEDSIVYYAKAGGYPITYATADNLKDADATYTLLLKNSTVLAPDTSRSASNIAPRTAGTKPKSATVTWTLEGTVNALNGNFAGGIVAPSTSYVDIITSKGVTAEGTVITDVSKTETFTLPNLNGRGQDGTVTVPVLKTTTTAAAVAECEGLAFASLEAASLYSTQEVEKAAVTVTGLAEITETFTAPVALTFAEGAAIVASNGVAITGVNNVYDPATVANKAARIGTAGYDTVADAMAAAAAGDTVVLLAAAEAVVLESGVILDPNGFTVASVTDITGAAVTANEDGTYGPVTAGTIMAETADGTKYFVTMAEALAEATGDIELLAAVSYEGTIALTEGAQLKTNGFELTATAVVDSVGTEIAAVDGVYHTYNTMAEVTLPSGEKQVLSLAAALTLAEANEGSTVKLLKDVTVIANDPYTDLFDNTYFYKATVDTTIDFNGKTLTAPDYGIVTENNAIDGVVPEVHLTILGNGGKLICTGAKSAIAINNGSLTASDLYVTGGYTKFSKDDPVAESNPISLIGVGETSTMTNVTVDSRRYIGIDSNHTLVLEGCKVNALKKDWAFYCAEDTTIQFVGTENIVTSVAGLQNGTRGTIVHEGLDMVTIPGTPNTYVFVPTGTVAFIDANGDKVINEGETAYTSAADFAAEKNAAIVLTAAVEGDVTLDASSTLDIAIAAPTGAVLTDMEGTTATRVLEDTVYKAVNATYQQTEDTTVYAAEFTKAIAMSQDATTGGGTVKLYADVATKNATYAIDLTDRGMTLDLNGHTITGYQGQHLIQLLRDKDVQDRLTILNGTLISSKSAVSIRGGGSLTMDGVTVISDNGSNQNVIWINNSKTEKIDGKNVTTYFTPEGTNYIKNSTITGNGDGYVVNVQHGAVMELTATTITSAIRAPLVATGNGVINLMGVDNVIVSAVEEFYSAADTTGEVKAQGIPEMTTIENEDGTTAYKFTFGVPDGIYAYIDLNGNEVFDIDDDHYEPGATLADILTVANEAGEELTVCLFADNAEDVYVTELVKLNVGAFTNTGKVILIDDNGEESYKLLPDHGIYSGNVEVEYIVGEDVYGTTFENAIDASVDEGLAGGTIKLLTDFDYTEQNLTYAIDLKHSVTIDLNGHFLKNNAVEKHLFRFMNNDITNTTETLTIKDSVGGGVLEATDTVIRMLGGNLVLDGVTIVNNTARDVKAVLLWGNEGKLSGTTYTITDCTITANGNSSTVVQLGDYGTLNIAGKTVITAAAGAAVHADSVNGTINFIGNEIELNHTTEAFYDATKANHGAMNFSAGYTFKTEAITVGEGEEAVTTYKTTIVALEKGEPVVGFTAPGAEEVLYYLSTTGLDDEGNNAYTSVEKAVGAATAVWKEVKNGTITLYTDLYITDRTASKISGTNFVYQNDLENASLIFDLNHHTIYYGSKDDSVAPAAGGGGNPALFSNSKNGYLEVRNGNIEWAGSRAFYLTGSSTAGAEKNGEKTTGETRFTNVNVTYASDSAAIFNVNNAFATETTPAAKITIDGGVWKHTGGNVLFYSTNDSDGTIFYITGGAELHAETRTANNAIFDGSTSGNIYIDDATIYGRASIGSELFYGNTVYTLGNPEGGLVKATVSATETAGINKIVFAEATADDYVANVNGEGYFTVAEAVAATSKYDTVNVIKTPAESAITLKATTYMAVAEGVDMTGITVSYENGVEAVLTDGVYAPAEAVYTYGDITVKGTARQAFQAWAANGNVGTITLMDDLTLTELNELGTGESRHFIILWDGYELTLNLNGHTVKRNTDAGATTAPNFIISVGDSKLEINGGADATDTANRGTIQWTGTRAILQIGGTDQRENSINAAFNNVNIEGYSRTGNVVAVSGTSAELENTVVFNNVTAKLYNALYSSEKNHPSNVKVVVTGNTTLIARKNAFTLGTDDTLTLGENVKVYGRNDTDLTMEQMLANMFTNVAEYTFAANTEDTVQAKHYRAGEGLGSDQLEGFGTENDIHYAYVATPVELTANAVNVYETGDENITVVADKAEAKKGEVVSLTVNVNGDYTVKAVVTTESGAAVRVSSDNKFVMPAEAVKVTVTADLNKYNVSLYAAGVENGTVVADVTEAAAGQTVTLTATPDEGYMVDKYFAQTADDKTAIAVSGNKFVMPGEAVEFYATFKVVPALYNIYVNRQEGGTIVVEGKGSVAVTPATAPAGATVKIEAVVADGYDLQIKVFEFTTGAEVEVVDNTFVMPEGGANVSASFDAKKYAINVAEAVNGSITTDASAAAGKTVVVDVDPAEGYELDTLTVTTASGVAVPVNNVTFVMPAEAVTVSATFKEIYVEPEYPTGTFVDNGNTLSLSDIIYVNKYVKITGFEGIDLTTAGGMLVWTEQVSGTMTAETAIMENAEIVKEGLIYDAKNKEYAQQTDGIPAKNYGDKLYMRMYVEVAEGVYKYSDLFTYSVREYAEGRIAKSTNAKLKQACVQLLYYGAAAQKYFGYKVDAPANAGILDKVPAAWAWDASLLTSLVEPNTNIVGDSRITDNGKTLSLTGAVFLNAYVGLQISGNVEKAELLFWNDVTGELTLENVTNRAELLKAGSYKGYPEYAAQSEMFRAKEYGKTLYICAHFVIDGVDYYGSVIGCSPEAYAAGKVNVYTTTDKANLADLCRAMVLYGEAAAQYLG